MKLSSRISRRLGTCIAVAGAAILVPAVALAASAASATPAHPAAAARCMHPSQSFRNGAFVWLAQPGSTSAGHATYQLEITNLTRHACTLSGAPRVAAVRNGHLVGAPVAGPESQITLRPGATAHLPLDVADSGAVCGHPVMASVVVYLPGQTIAQPAWMTTNVCRHKPGGGVLHFDGPIAAGIAIPLP